MSIVWLPKVVDTLERLYCEEGLDYGEIAGRLGPSFTEIGVKGKVHALGLLLTVEAREARKARKRIRRQEQRAEMRP